MCIRDSYQMVAEGKVQKELIQEGDTRYNQVDNAHDSPLFDGGSIKKIASTLLCGCGISKQKQKPEQNQVQQFMIIATIATAMRAANVADFYMTKYQSKAQEMLGPVIQPFVAGMRRIVQAENEPAAAEDTIVTSARRRIRRFIFSANHTTWYLSLIHI